MDKLKLNLFALKNAFIREFKGKTTTKRCICIPIEDNFGIEGKKGVYFEGLIRENENDFSKAFVTLAIPKSQYDNMTQEERRANSVIFANIEELKSKGTQLPTSSIPTVESEENDDLPF